MAVHPAAPPPRPARRHRQARRQGARRGRRRRGVTGRDRGPRRPAARPRRCSPPTGSPQTAFASFTTATVVTVPQEAVITEPTVLTLRGEGAEGAAYGHIVIDVAPFAVATVVLDHQGSATYAGNVEVLVGDGAALTFVSLQDWDDDTVHLGHQRIVLGRDATHPRRRGHLRRRPGPAVPAGELHRPRRRRGTARPVLRRRRPAPGAPLGSDHTVPNCRSNVAYKGALQGKNAHTVWIGDVIIRPEATGTDTYEINRNLILTDGARADSVPNLEILTGEIAGAGHASATGRFDDEQLFYLQSRGIPAVEARRLVVRGFFAEIIAADRHPADLQTAPARTPSRKNWPARSADPPSDPRRGSHAGRHRWSSEDMSTLEIKDLHVRSTTAEGVKEILRGVDPHHQAGRDACRDGPQRVRQVHPGLLDRRAPQVPGDQRAASPSTGRTSSRCPSTSGPAPGLFLAMQYPVEVPGVSVSNFLRTAKTAISGEAPKLRTWVKDMKAAMERAADGPDLRRAQRQRGLLRWREEAPRDPAARTAPAEDRDPRRDRLRPGHRRAQGRLRGRQPLPGRREQGRPADHALHADPALHRAGLRARLRRRTLRRGGRPGAGGAAGSGGLRALPGEGRSRR